MSECQILLHAPLVITQNENRDILENAGIAIANGKIAAIGAWPYIRKKWHGLEEIFLADQLIMPGLINSHSHAAMTFLRGLAEDLPLMDWLNQVVFPIEAQLTPEITKLGSLLGYAEMIATGTTACIDMYIFEEAAFEAAEISGIRCLGGEAVFAFPSAACPNYKAALESTAALAEKYRGNNKIKVAVNPHSVYTTNAEILGACRDLALKLDLPLHIHLAETCGETQVCEERNGMRPIAWCGKNGLLDTRLIAAHLVDVTASEARLLAASGACGAHNPSSNMKLASGACPLGLLLECGLPMGLGTDGPASNNQLNMFAEMSRAALLQKHARRDPACLGSPQILDMATLGGASAFGDSSLGRLMTGARADLIALDLTAPNLQPLHNPVSQIVYSASGHEVRFNMIGGEIVYRNGKFTRFNYKNLLDETRKLKEFVKRKKTVKII